MDNVEISTTMPKLQRGKSHDELQMRFFVGVTQKFAIIRVPLTDYQGV